MSFLAKLPTLILILASVGLNASAQICLRAGARGGLAARDGLLALALDIATRPGILGGLVCYGLSVLLWIYVLSRAEASYAYPFLGLGFVVVAVAGWLLLGETLTMQRLVATLIIVAGVALLARS